MVIAVGKMDDESLHGKFANPMPEFSEDFANPLDTGGQEPPTKETFSNPLDGDGGADGEVVELVDDRDEHVDGEESEESLPAHYEQRRDVVLSDVLFLPAHLDADDDLRQHNDGVAERRVGGTGVRGAAGRAERGRGEGRGADDDRAADHHADAEPNNCRHKPGPFLDVL